jgi:hypothetical protein
MTDRGFLMSPKKNLSYALVAVSLLLLAKLSCDSTRRHPQPGSQPPSEIVVRELPSLPVEYSLGTFDSRFGITQERFLQIAEDAKKIWNDAAGKDLFRFSEDGPLKVNLIFDWRQEKLLAAKTAKAGIDENGRSFEQLKTEYEERERSVEPFKSSFEEFAHSLKVHMDEYNARVARWNQGGKNSESEYQYLQTRKKELEDEQASVDRRREELNSKGEELNKLAEGLNAFAKKINLDVELFNGKYVQTRDFEKGMFDGSAISIYEFEKEDDLRLTLIHEFGHALGIGHAEDPKAIMYRKLAVQDLGDIRLTKEDIDLLREKLK